MDYQINLFVLVLVFYFFHEEIRLAFAQMFDHIHQKNALIPENQAF